MPHIETIIINIAVPHENDEYQKQPVRLPISPSVKVDLDESCTEDDCAEMARLAFRRLKERGD